jgi:hypothetical protein
MSSASLEELARARPKRASLPARCVSHKANIFQLLCDRAKEGRGVLGSELYSRPDLYGRSPRNRVSELRREDGHLIEGRSYGTSDWLYRLIRDASGASAIVQSTDEYDRETGRPRPSEEAPLVRHDDLPLFAGMARS